MTSASQNSNKSQLDKFKEAAQEALCDEDEARWEKRLREVVKQPLNENRGSGE